MFSYIDVVAGAQFGSESKGRVAGDLVRYRSRQAHWGADTNSSSHPVISVRVGGPNAGHVVVGRGGQHFAMRQVPVGFIEDDALLYIAAGSEVDFDVLDSEVRMLHEAGYDIMSRLYLDPQATVLTPEHIEQERNSDIVERLGSTAKGIGASRADRIWRTAQLVRDSERAADYQVAPLGDVVDLDRQRPAVVIEGTQGYGLGLHAGYYPQCTSNDTRAIDFAAMAGINPWEVQSPDRFNIHLVVRPYPIRVAGNSGPLADETSWEDLGLEAERTTVTQKIRRVGRLDLDLVRAAVQANGPTRSFLHLAMADQVDKSPAGLEGFESAELWEQRAAAASTGDAPRWDHASQELLTIIRDLADVAPVVSLGTGPDSTIHLSGVEFEW